MFLSIDAIARGWAYQNRLHYFERPVNLFRAGKNNKLQQIVFRSCSFWFAFAGIYSRPTYISDTV